MYIYIELYLYRGLPRRYRVNPKRLLCRYIYRTHRYVSEGALRVAPRADAAGARSRGNIPINIYIYIY